MTAVGAARYEPPNVRIVTDGVRRVTRSTGVLLAILLAVVALGVVKPLAAAAQMPIRSVRIAGSLSHADRAVLRAAVEGEIAGGFFHVDVDAVRRAAMATPWIREASVRRVWPDSLHVAVIERVAVARWKSSGLLDEDGTLFSPDETTIPPGLSQLQGPQGTQMGMLTQLKRLDDAFEGPGWRITRLELSQRSIWTATLGNGVEFVLGAAESGRDLRRVVNAVAVAVGKQMGKVARIDLRYANGFSVRWTNTDAEKG